MAGGEGRLRTWLDARREKALLRDEVVPVAVLVTILLIQATQQADLALHEVEQVGAGEAWRAALAGIGRALSTLGTAASLLLLAPLATQGRARRMLLALVVGAMYVWIAGFAAPVALSSLHAPARVALSQDPAYWTLFEGLVNPGDPVADPRFAFWLGAWIVAATLCVASLPLLLTRTTLRLPWWLVCPAGIVMVAACLAMQVLVHGVMDEPSWLANALAPALPVSLCALALAKVVRDYGGPAPEQPQPLCRALRTLVALPLACVACVVLWAAILGALSPSSLANAWPRQPPRIGDLAPDFELAALDGSTTRLSSQRPRTVLVVFWATWCGPCVAEWPMLVELARDRDHEVRILALSRDRDRDALVSFLEDWPVRPAVLLCDEPVARAYDIQGIPCSFLVDANGRIAWTSVGYGPGSEDLLEAALMKLRQ